MGFMYLCQENPMITASPDGLMKDATIKIKCSTKEKSEESYLKNGLITEKCKAQVQLQMYTTGRYFCVADSNLNVDIILVTKIGDYVNNLIKKVCFIR